MISSDNRVLTGLSLDIHPFQDPKLEVPTIYKAFFQAYVSEYWVGQIFCQKMLLYPGPQAKANPAQDVEGRGERGHGRGEQHPEPNGLDVAMMEALEALKAVVKIWDFTLWL